MIVEIKPTPFCIFYTKILRLMNASICSVFVVLKIYARMLLAVKHMQGRASISAGRHRLCEGRFPERLRPALALKLVMKSNQMSNNSIVGEREPHSILLIQLNTAKIVLDPVMLDDTITK